MPTDSDTYPLLYRDGASQAQRMPAALDPAYVALDERSIRDLLAFAQQYAQELRYVDDELNESGDWSAFLDGDHDEMVAYLYDPEAFAEDAAKKERYSRPHLVLFLTFLHLLQHAQTQLNDFTRRHLEFYYQQALRLTPRQAVPDRVHVLVELIGRQDQALVPAGTLLQAGQDSQGVDLFYTTDDDLVANQATVASLKSLFVEKKIIGIREIHQDPESLLDVTSGADRSWEDEPSLPDKAFMAMMDMALGDPNPGDPLPLYPDGSSAGKTVDRKLIEELDALLDFIQDQLKMSVSVFRNVMQRKRGLDGADEQWDQVNAILQKAGRIKKNNDTYVLNLEESGKRDFEANLDAALGPLDYGGLPEVEDIYDLYFQYLRRRDEGQDVQERQDIEAFIKGQYKEEGKDPTGLHMTDLADFETMMGFIDETYLDWRQLYDLLRAAGKRKGQSLDPMTTSDLRADDSDKFDTITARTLLGEEIPPYPSISGVTLKSFDGCYDAVLTLEAYFFMAAEDFGFIRAIQAEPEAPSWEWEQVYEVMEAAHRQKVLAGRRAALKKEREDNGFEAMIKFALGHPEPGDALSGGKVFMDLDPTTDAVYIEEELYLDGVNVAFIQHAAEEDWDTVYNILEQAQRRKRGWEEPVVRIEKWENVYVAADATQVLVQSGLEDEEATARWHTFGGSGEEAGMASATVGLAVVSPVLALAEGTRTITLTLGFNEDHFDAAAIGETLAETIPFRFFLSTEKEMVEIADVTVVLYDAVGAPAEASSIQITEKNSDEWAERRYDHALRVVLTLDAQAPPIAPLPADSGFRTPWPVLQLLLKDIEIEGEETVTKPYLAFQDLVLEHVHLKVEVSGITALTLQNDDAVLDAKKPFEPFGLSPVVGSSFYVAHPELCAKRLDTLDLDIDWLAAPDDLNHHYLGYKDYGVAPTDQKSPVADNTSFTARLKLYDNRAFFEIGDPVSLFHAEAAENDTNGLKTMGAAQTHTISVILGDITARYAQYAQDLQPVTDNEVLAWSRYWQFELAGLDFQHAVYPLAASAYAGKEDKDSNPLFVNPPYTPKIKRLTAGYSASVELTPGALAGADQLYHVEPFGYRALPADADGQYAFLPQYENQGELYIGLEALAPPQNLSLLFQMAEGSADPDLAREAVHWDYLSGDQWHSLEQGNLLADTTNGLLNSGIIRFSLEPAQPSTVLPPPWYWIRATIAQDGQSVCDTVAIRAQAVCATFEDHGNAPDHLDHLLPPETITGLATPRPEVKAIHQPYSSVGGKGPEEAGRFYTRVSERLRHKNRALTSWDYERLILEAFPDVYKVQCLPVDAFDDPRLAGAIQIIVIPDIQGKLPSDPFEPKAPTDTLLEIERYLLARSSPLARFTVKNPRYVQLKARFAVRFREGYNPGYYLPLLNEALQRYLSPWAYDESAEIVFGGKINANLIVNFVDERDYVDYVAGITLYTSPDGAAFTEVPEDGDVLTVAAGAPDIILVSARQHEIDLITEEVYVEEAFIGIDYMKIELDFKVAEDPLVE